MTDPTRLPCYAGTEEAASAHGVVVSAARWCAGLTFTSPKFRAVTGAAPVDERVVSAVLLPWPLAKALSLLLADQISRYEAEEGPIALPRSFAPVFGRTVGGPPPEA